MRKGKEFRPLMQHSLSIGPKRGKSVARGTSIHESPRRCLLGSPCAESCINWTDQDNDLRATEHQCPNADRNTWRHRIDIRCRPCDVG